MFTRRAFTALTAATIAAPATIAAQTPQSVLVIGAGAAGLTAAYHLQKQGIDVQVLEASDQIGGRTKRQTGLASVPLDLGAEWIHSDPEILGQITGDGATDLGIATIDYAPQTFQTYQNGRFLDFNLLRHAYAEVKFKYTTWFGFLERHLATQLRDDIRLNAEVTQIELKGAGVSVRLRSGETLDADAAVVTVPLSVLQRGAIAIAPDLRPPQFGDLADVAFGQGFKVFMTFRERFYPDILYDVPRAQMMADSWNAKIYYDAAFGKEVEDNILGLFTVHETDLPRTRMSDTELLSDVLDELASWYGTDLRSNFIAGQVQNWSATAHINGSYSMTNNSRTAMEDILSPQEGRLFFAGEALGGDDQSTVHGAALSAIRAVDQLTHR